MQLLSGVGRKKTKKKTDPNLEGFVRRISVE
jgi:hypothetical protein